MPKAKKKSSYSASKGQTSKAARKAAKGRSHGTAQPHQSPNRKRKSSKKPHNSTKRSRTRRSGRRGQATEIRVREEVSIAAELLSSLPANVWWRILQDPNGEDDLASGSRQEYRVILPVLLKANLISTVNVDGKYRLDYCSAGWEELGAIGMGIRMQTTAMHVNGSASYYVVVGPKPKYRNPFEQAKAVSADGMEAALGIRTVGMRVNTRLNKQDDRTMKERLEQYRLKVRAQALSEALTALEDMNDDDLREILERSGKMAHDFKKNTRVSSAVAAAAEDCSSSDGGVEEGMTDGEEATAGDTGTGDDAWASEVDEQIANSIALDLSIRPRPRRDGNGMIDVDEKKKQTNEKERMLLLSLARLWGYYDSTLTWKERTRVAAAACKQVAYDHGFAKSTGACMLHQWDKMLTDGVRSGAKDPLASDHRGSVSETDKLESEHPGYLHHLYRYAIRTVGIKASFQEITDAMNEKSATPLEQRPALSLHYLQVYRWFVKNGGKEKSSKEKPRLTDEQKSARVEWVRKRREEGFLDEDFPVCYLDEKWFYTVSRRRKIKVLPLGDNEEAGADFVVRPKTRSRRFPIKVMYLGVVARPRPDKNFSGRIVLERVSKTKKVESRTKHQRFAFDALVNDEIKRGGWKEYYIPGMTAGELCDIITDVYELDEFVSERLEFHYASVSTGAKKTKSNKRLRDSHLLTGHQARNEAGEVVHVTLDDLHLGVRYKDDDEVEEDISCDSDFMLRIMPKVGEKVRAAFYWLPIGEKQEDGTWLGGRPIFTILDSAGGHGTNEAIEKYRKQLLDEYNIILVHQIPQSPETNVLDLGIWMSLQAAVEKSHRLKRGDTDALHATVMKVWEEVTNEEAFENVFERLKMVYHNILRNRGGNDMVEDGRGKKGREETFGDVGEAVPLFELDGGVEDSGEGEVEDGGEAEEDIMVFM